MSASEPTFPLEIFDCIIDQVAQDRKTLIEWSPVCRDWAAACRRHLLSEVVLSAERWGVLRNLDPHLYARSVMLTCPRRVYKIKTTSEQIFTLLLIFFLSKLPQKLVRFLLSAPTVDELLAVGPVSQFNNEMLQRPFPNVTFLLVKFRPTGAYGSQCHRHYNLLGALPNLFPRITTLEFFDLFNTFYETVQFICSFPELETLVLSFVEAHNLNGNHVDHFLLPVGLKTVTLRHTQRKAECVRFVEWLSAIEPTPQIISFTCVEYSPAFIEPLSRLFRKLGNTLQDLRLTYDFRPSTLFSFLLQLLNVT